MCLFVCFLFYSEAFPPSLIIFLVWQGYFNRKMVCQELSIMLISVKFGLWFRKAFTLEVLGLPPVTSNLLDLLSHNFSWMKLKGVIHHFKQLRAHSWLPLFRTGKQNCVVWVLSFPHRHTALLVFPWAWTAGVARHVRAFNSVYTFP